MCVATLCDRGKKTEEVNYFSPFCEDVFRASVGDGLPQSLDEPNLSHLVAALVEAT